MRDAAVGVDRVLERAGDRFLPDDLVLVERGARDLADSDVEALVARLSGDAARIDQTL